MPADELTLDRVERQQSGSGVMLIGRTLFNRADYNPDMQGQAGTAKYERMRRDPEIAGCLMRWKWPIKSANWTFEEPTEGDRIDEKMELCNRYIMGDGQEDARLTFKGGLLPHLLLAIDFGFAAFEKVWGIDEKGRQVIARYAPILPQSVREFEIDDYGALVRLVQYAYVADGKGGSSFRRQSVPDPALGGTAEEKIGVYTYRQEGDDYFGRPPLRELFQAWFHKQELWSLDGIQKERNGLGFTVIKIPQSITDTTSPAYRAAMQIASETRSNERMGAVIGEDWELLQQFPTGTPPDILGSQKYCDEQIARGMGVEYSQLASFGSTGGGRALGESKIDNFLMGEQALADSFEEFVNTQLVPILMRRNGLKRPWPRIQCEDLDKMSGGQLSEILANLGTGGFIVPDRDLEDHLRENLDLPEVDDATRVEQPDPLEVAAAQAAATGGGGQGKVVPLKQPGKPEPTTATKAATAAPVQSRLRRALHSHEAHVDFERMAEYLDTEPDRIWYRVVKPVRDVQIDKIAKAAASVSVKELANGTFGQPMKGALAADLSVALLGVYARGRKDVKAEVARQRGVASKADDGEGDDDEVTPAQVNWVKRLAEGFAAFSTMALISEAVRAGLNAHQRDLPAARVEQEVRNALSSLSEPRVMADLGGKVAQVLTTGRNDQIAEMRDQFGAFFYSAAMDSGTCEVCQALDGAEHEYGDSTYQTPNPNCFGGIDRCRCETVAIVREVAA